ncbi:MAG: hypothetical protein MI739_04420 [Bacteroidales bacterium]|nr:hypothetical protein [Bacteroidales bacterium]
MNYFNRFISATIILSIFLSYSCTFDSEEEFFKNYYCDTTNITYNDLTYIFTDICAVCHSQTITYRDGILTDTYESTKLSIKTGLVIPSIKHTGPYPMPYQQPKLSDCDITKIEAWINARFPIDTNKTSMIKDFNTHKQDYNINTNK